ncbi:hypothetical protein OA177_01775 [Candidatus Pelagibacter sp.]|nr:hypothetical protein [Candidatus Pelagibacter sp.]
MKKIFFLSILILLSFNAYSPAENNNCSEFNKFSVEYLKCKGNLIKDKTISTGKNIVEDTKKYQNEEWSEEKKKIEKAKDKINKTKEKVLN